MKKALRYLALCIMCAVIMCNSAAMAQGEDIIIEVIPKYGNLGLSISGTDFLAMGYEFGDIVTAEIMGTEYDMPVGSNYSDVDNGEMVCRVNIDPETGEDMVTLAICMGDMAAETGVAVKTETEDEPGFRWDFCTENGLSPIITFSMKEKGGYAAEYEIRQLVRTNAREDYAHLTDEEFANFRAVETSGMGKGALYRSSSPIDPELGRNTYADAAIESKSIHTIFNMADSEAAMAEYPGFNESAYSNCSVIALEMPMDFMAGDFLNGMAEGLRFIIANDGPYLIHCTEGKDRTGFACALVECLMGGGADEVVSDYMATFVNYYGVEGGSEQYDRIAKSSIVKILEEAFGISGIMGGDYDLVMEAEEYLAGIGLSGSEINALKEKLSADY